MIFLDKYIFLFTTNYKIIIFYFLCELLHQIIVIWFEESAIAYLEDLLQEATSELDKEKTVSKILSFKALYPDNIAIQVSFIYLLLLLS